MPVGVSKGRSEYPARQNRKREAVLVLEEEILELWRDGVKVIKDDFFRVSGTVGTKHPLLRLGERDFLPPLNEQKHSGQGILD